MGSIAHVGQVISCWRRRRREARQRTRRYLLGLGLFASLSFASNIAAVVRRELEIRAVARNLLELRSYGFLDGNF